MFKVLTGSQISYKEAESLLLSLGYVLRVKGSHTMVLEKPVFKNIIIAKRAQLLAYQIKQIQEVLIDHGHKK